MAVRLTTTFDEKRSASRRTGRWMVDEVQAGNDSPRQRHFVLSDARIVRNYQKWPIGSISLCNKVAIEAEDWFLAKQPMCPSCLAMCPIDERTGLNEAL